MSYLKGTLSSNSDYWNLLAHGVPLPSTIQQIKAESAAGIRKAGGSEADVADAAATVDRTVATSVASQGAGGAGGLSQNWWMLVALAAAGLGVGLLLSRR